MQGFGMITCNKRQATNSISTYTHQPAYLSLSAALSQVMEYGDDLLYGKTAS
jgi:hypothetical protein